MEDSEWNEIVGLLAAQSVSCGILHTSTPNCDTLRDALVECLQNLAKLIRQYYNNEDNVKTSSNEFLMEIESAAANLREKTKEFLGAQREEITEINCFCDELRSLGQSRRDCQRLILHSRSLMSAFRKKCLLEKRALEHAVESLQYIYCNVNKPSDSFLEAASTLAQKPFVEKSQYGSVLSLIELWREQSSKKQEKKKPGLQFEESKIPKIAPNASKTPPADQAQELPRPLERFSFLLRKQIHGIHTVLLVGSEGAGKTHTCDQLAAHAGTDTQGTALIGFISAY